MKTKLKTASVTKVKSSFEALESRVLFSHIVALPPHATITPPVVSTANVAAVNTGTGLTGEFFIGNNFQTPVVVRTDSKIDFKWTKGRPDQILPKGVFTARWTGQVQPTTSDTYTFYTKSDAGTRVIVNGTTILDNFSATTASTTSGTIALTAGTKYSISVEYVSRGTGISKMQLLWSSSTKKTQIVPKSALFVDATVALPAGSSPLSATYYYGPNFNTPVMTRAETRINYDWGTGTPDQAIGQHRKFSVRWLGQIVAPTTGVYTFKTKADDGVRLFVNGQLIINNFKLDSDHIHRGKISLVAGQAYDVRLDYFEDGTENASAQMFWALPGQTRASTVVPFTIATPAAPTNLQSSIVSNTSIHLSWNDVPNETGFILYRSTDGGVTFTQLTTPATGVTSFDDNTVTGGVPYQYYIVATGVGANSPSSNITSVTIPLVAPSPVVASATASGSTSTVTWTIDPTASSYLVERSANGTSGWTTVTTSTSASASEAGLATGATYFYRVTAINAAGPSAPSNVVNITIVTAAPTALATTVVSASQINLHWTDVTGETSYIVQKSLNGTSGWIPIGTTGANVTTFAASGLSPATQYFFRIIAVDAGGNSSPSNVANGTTSAANPSYATLTTLYGLTGNGKVYSIDTSNGAAAQIGTLSFGTNAAGRDPFTSEFYYISTGTSTVAISAWSPFDGSNRVVNASVPLSGAVAQAAFRTDGLMFLATDIGDLYAINADTGAAQLRGNIHANGVTLNTGNGDMAFAPDGTLYLETSSELYSIVNTAVDAATGAGSILTATDIGSTGGGNLQLAFGQNGILFGTDAAGQLYTINKTTAASTPVGSVSGINMGDLASVPLYTDLSITQSASALVRGSTGAYTLTVHNAGPDTTVGPITLVDTLPAGVTFTGGSGTGWTFNTNGQTVTMTYTPNLAAGATTPAVTVNVAISTGVAASVTNSATVSTTVFETVTTNNSSSLNTAVTG